MSNIDDYKNLWSELWSVFRYDVIRSKPDYMELFKIKYEHAVSLLKRDPRPDLSTRNILICNIDPQISSGGNITAAHSMYSLFELIERGPRGQVTELSASVFKTDWVTIATALCYNPNVTDTIPLDINAVFKHLCDGQSNGVPEAIGMNAGEAFDVLSKTWRGFNSTVANRMYTYKDGALITESSPYVRFSDGQKRTVPSTIPPFMPGNSMGWDIAILLLLGLVVVKVEDENSIGYANVGSVSIGTLANLHKSEYTDFFSW